MPTSSGVATRAWFNSACIGRFIPQRFRRVARLGHEVSHSRWDGCMFLRLTGWLQSQFTRRHSWRDVDLTHWWQMPDDQTRTTSPWLQLPVDLVSRATFSEWHEKVAETRVGHYDRQRPYVARAAFLAAMTAGLGLLDVPWWSWIMLMPAVAQVALEIYLYPFIHEGQDDPRWRLFRRMRDMANHNQRTMMLNVTGLLGVVACPLNVVAVASTPPGGHFGWVKVVTFAIAILYVNSGLASAFLDPSNYTETSRMPPIMHRIRPVAPVLSLIVVVCVVAISITFDRWAADMAPLAYATATLTLLLGSTLRNHDRVVAAAAMVARKAVIESRKELGRVVHDDLNPAKTAAETIRQIDGVPYKDYVELAALEAYLTHFSTRMGIYAEPKLRINDLVEKVVSPYGLTPGDVTYDIVWPTDLKRETHATAIRMTTALVLNAVQAMQKTEYLGARRALVIEGFTTGEDQDLRFHLAVRDHLPPIAADKWCRDGTTLAALRDWLDETFGGDLRQEVLGDCSKRIVASWLDRRPVRGYQGNTWRKAPS